ncbi:MAG: hypothetical protein ACPL88_12350, partial [Bryobacteraceae bacterium]
SGGQLEIQIPNLNGGSWVVAVHVGEPSATAELTATWVKSRPSLRGVARIPEEFAEAAVERARGPARVGHSPPDTRGSRSGAACLEAAASW